MLDTQRTPDAFHGDFEDDIEFRMKMHQMGTPSIQIVPLRYSKTGQKSNKDESGNRAAYTAAGLKRGEHMVKLYGDVYSCRMREQSNCIGKKGEGVFFKHFLKSFNDGLLVKDMDAINAEFTKLLRKYATKRPDRVKITTKRK